MIYTTTQTIDQKYREEGMDAALRRMPEEILIELAETEEFSPVQIGWLREGWAQGLSLRLAAERGERMCRDRMAA